MTFNLATVGALVAGFAAGYCWRGVQLWLRHGRLMVLGWAEAIGRAARSDGGRP